MGWAERLAWATALLFGAFVWVLLLFGKSASAAMEPEEIMVRLATNQPIYPVYRTTLPRRVSPKPRSKPAR